MKGCILNTFLFVEVEYSIYVFQALDLIKLKKRVGMMFLCFSPATPNLGTYLR
jgi:hypothetical protein